ncbi:SIR2 family protein [Bifidobacterium subtile]|jgi:hypothetical protein|uniref:SIR2 family protein n=1 Tax=Bifidobacterium subtile TaxID=77635 RepID=UPI002F352306
MRKGESTKDSAEDASSVEKEAYHFISAVNTLSGKLENDKYISFKENGEELSGELVHSETSNKSVEYSIQDFKKNVTSKVSLFLRPRFDQIVLLVGSGGSVVPDDSPNHRNSKYGHIMSDLLADIESEPSLGTEQEYLSFKTMKKKAQCADDNNLENILSQLEKAEDFIPSDSKTKYSNTLIKIREIIKDKTKYNYDMQRMQHLALINSLNKRVKEGNKLSIVTTNYDTMLEDAATEGKYTVFDGFTFTANPEFDAKMFDWTLVKDVPNLDTKELIYDKKVINLLKLHGSLTWKKPTNDESIRKISKENNDEPLMIFPSSKKYEQSYRAPYSDLFYKFRELLNRPRTLLLTVGFSFEDFHIFEMVNDAILHNDGLSLLFTDINIGSEKPSNDSNLGKLKQRMSEGYRVAFLKATLNNTSVNELENLIKYLEPDNND